MRAADKIDQAFVARKSKTACELVDCAGTMRGRRSLLRPNAHAADPEPSLGGLVRFANAD
jgi:hypothetical protein